jgi:predicted alpha/beta superfamily hydrolase
MNYLGAQTCPQLVAKEHPMLNLSPASIPATHARIVHSAMANDDYLISVALPFHYEERPDTVWPVIYVLDGNMHFNMVVDMVRFMNIRVEFCNELPDALIVGIGYPVTGTLTDMLYQVMHLRMRDFVLGREESGEAFMQEHFPIAASIPSGNGLSFMRFLRQELIPWIETDYQADPADRTLLGHSMGANFALYTLFHHPDLFQRCVAASFDPMLDQEQAFAEDNDNLPVRLHLIWEGISQQDLAGPRSLVDRLTTRGYDGLRITHETVLGTHCAIVPFAYQSGLVKVFSK